MNGVVVRWIAALAMALLALGAAAQPLEIEGDGKSALLLSSVGRDKAAVTRVSLADGAATVVADAVLAPVGVVGVARAEHLRNRREVIAALVLVADEKADRRARSASFVDARENFHGVGLAPLRDMAR